MEFDFVYADLKVQVIFKGDNDSVFGSLTDKEVVVLQQQVYQTLTLFCMLRGFYLMDLIDKDKIRGQDAADEAAGLHEGDDNGFVSDS